MPVSGLVVTTRDEAALAALRQSMARDPHVVPGEARGARWALVVDTPDAARDREVWNRLSRAPGVVAVDVVFVQFDESPAEMSSSDDSSSTNCGGRGS